MVVWLVIEIDVIIIFLWIICTSCFQSLHCVIQSLLYQLFLQTIMFEPLLIQQDFLRFFLFLVHYHLNLLRRKLLLEITQKAHPFISFLWYSSVKISILKDCHTFSVKDICLLGQNVLIVHLLNLQFLNQLQYFFFICRLLIPQSWVMHMY